VSDYNLDKLRIQTMLNQHNVDNMKFSHEIAENKRQIKWLCGAVIILALTMIFG
jgi:hypothetical protein